ncbi:MAG: cache domain-containing protein [Gammaproteobacteria bacterium]|nr:cache domain-containing protein [Gammaproteobacteria bacterium]
MQTRNALVEHTKQTFAALDVALESIAEDVDLDAIASQDAYRALAAGQAAIAPALTLFILDAGGRLVASSHVDVPVAIDLSESETFRHHSANSKDDLFISTPRIGAFGPTRGEWIITVSRSIPDAAGGTAGVVAAAVSLPYLNDFYEAVRPGRQGAIGLIRIDGPILSGSPFSPTYIGFDASTVPRFRALRAASESGTFRADTVIDGVNRINAYARVPGLPLVVLVGVGTAERLAEWRTRAKNEAVIGTLAIVLVWLLALFLRERVQERQAEGNARIAQVTRLTEISTELMACNTVVEALDKVARCARELVPAHQSVASVTTKLSVSDVVRCVSLSDRYAARRDFDARIDGSGIYRILFKDKHPVRMTRAELESHPARKGFGAHKDTHPPMRGWLAAPRSRATARLSG